LLLLGARVALTLLILHLLAFDAVAWAMALAPNAGRVTAAPRPPALEVAHPGSRRFVRVGPTPATLAVWTVEAREREARGTVVLLHGIRMDRRSLAPLAAALSDAGYRALLLDLRGHGASSGRYLTYGRDEAHDVSQVLDALQADGVELGPVAVFGFSYGAVVALEVVARDSRVRTAIAVSAFASLREVVRDYQANYLRGPLRWLPDAWFQAALDDAARISSFDPDLAGPERAITRGSTPVLLLHGDADRQIQLRHSQRLQRLSAGRARLVTVRGGTHEGMLAQPRVRAETLAWLDAQL
jgi:pimeloyl-ACP methyl ester carboxylesterase